MSKFYSVKQLGKIDSKLATARSVFERALISSAYQTVMTGQVAVGEIMSKLEDIRGYKAAGRKLRKHIGLTDTMISQGKLGDKGKEAFKKLRTEWAELGCEAAVYDSLKAAAFPPAEDKDKPEKSVHEKTIAYLGKLDVSTFTDLQKEALSEFTAALLLGAKEGQTVAELAAGEEPAH